MLWGFGHVAPVDGGLKRWRDGGVEGLHPGPLQLFTLLCAVSFSLFCFVLFCFFCLVCIVLFFCLLFLIGLFSFVCSVMFCLFSFGLVCLCHFRQRLEPAQGGLLPAMAFITGTENRIVPCSRVPITYTCILAGAFIVHYTYKVNNSMLKTCMSCLLTTMLTPYASSQNRLKQKNSQH